MSQKLTLDAEPRDDLGKSASRRHRRLDKLVPAIIYGGKDENQKIKPQLATLYWPSAKPNRPMSEWAVRIVLHQ